MGLKVIGAGFGRTGTRSLKTALEKLGFGKCYHMEEVIKHPSHLGCWAEIMDGKSADWDTLFDGYHSATDWPVAAYYQELMVVYPEAKIVLTVRDPEHWHKSIMNTLYQHSRKFRRFASVIPVLYRFLDGMEKVIWTGIFHRKLEDKSQAVAVFENHIEEVKRVVPANRLLIFQAKDGWKPLCAFLDVPVPENVPYPHKNKGAFFRKLLKHKTLLKWTVLTVAAGLMLLLIRVLVM